MKNVLNRQVMIGSGSGSALNVTPAQLGCFCGRRDPAAARRSAIPPAFISVFLLAFTVPQLGAQYVDDHNPVGVTGIFNGNVTTGCSYDPLTHSAHRAIDDIVVPGSVGKYPLKMTRYYNSRQVTSTARLGPGWSHEYAWAWDPSRGKVDYPTGSVWENHCESPVGVSDWLVSAGYPYGAFRLADGGTVVWDANGRASQIIDPYGQTTTITYMSNSMTVTEPGGRYLYITYGTQQVNGGNIARVEAHGLGNVTITDWVNYRYTQVPGGGTLPDQWCLTGVTYSDGTSASYTYEEDNVPDNLRRGSFKFQPLLSTANDVRYNGPMCRIAYNYQDHGPHGAITAERYSASDGNKGVIVSSIPGNLPSPLSGGQAFEMPRDFTETTRGDGPTRTFHYTRLKITRSPEPDGCPEIVAPVSDASSQFLLNYTDFQGHTTWLGYDKGSNNEKWYVKSVTDARGAYEGDPNYTTTYTRGPAPPAGIGEILSVTYPNNSGTIGYTYSDHGHYLTQVADERSKTVHTRDGNHRITQTDYKDANNTLLAYETFDWCDQAGDPQCGSQTFGQLKRHRQKNGAYVHYRYDPRGLLIDKWEPTWTATASDSEPKTHYDYYTSGPWTDRVKKMTLPANVSGNVASETYEYDRVLGTNGITNLNGAAVPGRGLVTKTTHADDKFQRFAYDAYGNKRWEDNELRKAASYIYDEYNRLTNVTRPLNGITDYTYNPTNGNGSRLSHTTNNPDTVKVRTGANSNIITNNIYDENFRKTSSTVAGATTWFHYDNVGHQDYVTDPRGSQSGDPRYTTFTDFDARNRKWRIREPLNRTTQFYYDDKINLTRILRPDQTTETKTYDGLNRVLTDTVPKEPSVNIVTQFQYYPSNVRSAGLLQTVTDGESHNTTFEYDPSGSKTKMTYHDNSYQSWAYDDAHNLKSRRTVGNETQNFSYDNRNRKTAEWWDGLPADGEWRVFGYDDANHLILATNGVGAYWDNFIADVRRSYDDAGRLTQDQQKVYVNGVPITKNVNYPSYYDNGQLYRLFVDGVSPAYDYAFLYDNMGRFEKIQVTGNLFIFQYQYDPASNEKQRDNLFDGVSQFYPRDALNRMQYLDLKKGANTLGHEGYAYDTASRLQSVTREDNKQDSFVYYLDGELKQATYGAAATPPPTPTPGGTPTPPPGQVQTPTFRPDGYDYSECAFNHTFDVVISTATSGAQIRYTTDGSDPNTGGTVIANGGTAQVFVPAGQTKTLKAIGFKTGMTNSNVHSADFTFDRECGQGPGTYPLDAVASPLGQGPIAPEVNAVTYTLDKAGNRRSVNGTSYSPNTINQYTSVGGAPVTNGNDHEIQTYGGFTFTYMRDQELIRVASTTPGLIYDLAYDALGRCVKRTGNGAVTYYFYDGEKPILEYNGNNALVGFNVYGKGTDEIIERGAYGSDNQWHWYFLQQDHEGSVTHLTDTNGTVIERYRYDAFGAPAIYAPNWTQRQTSSYSNRFLFTGREYAGAWVYEYRARVYSSYLGRFMSEDPKLFDAGDYNLFRYCHNDPIDFSDPMGLAGDAGGGAVIDTPSIDRLKKYVQAKELLGGGAIEIGKLNYAIGQTQQALDRHPVDFNISMGRDPRQNWNRDIHATAFSGGNDPTDDTNPAFLNRKLGPNESGAALPGGDELRGRSIDVVYTRTGARQNAIPVVDKGPFFDGTWRRPADRYWNTGARPLAESTRANRSGLDLSPRVWRNFGFGIRSDRYGVPYPTSRYDPDPVFDWRFH